jgi:hypothetical protein
VVAAPLLVVEVVERIRFKMLLVKIVDGLRVLLIDVVDVVTELGRSSSYVQLVDLASTHTQWFFVPQFDERLDPNAD